MLRPLSVRNLNADLVTLNTMVEEGDVEVFGALEGLMVRLDNYPNYDGVAQFAGPSLRMLGLHGTQLAFHDIAAALHRAKGLTSLIIDFGDDSGDDQPIDFAGVAELGDFLASLPVLRQLDLNLGNVPLAEQ
eukprot:gene15588-59932_t